MLSSREVLPERYGPHSATTRCAPLPGLPPVMVSDLMSAMTTSSCLRVLLRTKAPDVVATELGRSEVLSWKSFHPGLGESIRRCGEGRAAIVVTAEQSLAPPLVRISATMAVVAAPIFIAMAMHPQRNHK